MKINFHKFAVAAILMAVGLTISGAPMMAHAEDDTNETETGVATSISISPVSKILQLQPSVVYEDSFKVTNNGSSDMPFEVYASPYSYTCSEESGEYQLGFSQENSYTQMTRWITFKGPDGAYTTSPKFNAGPGESVVVEYRITTPDSIPAGGQYAVLFAHTLSSTTNSGGIKTEASPGLVVYGRSNGETITSAEITSTEIHRSLTDTDGNTKNIINAVGKVKNTGNVDFTAGGNLKVEGVFGQVYYETPSSTARISIIPDAELAVSDKWEETPYFGLFKATWTVSAAGESETISQIILILPAPIIVVMVLLLTAIILWIIIMVRKRRERRSRFMI